MSVHGLQSWQEVGLGRDVSSDPAESGWAFPGFQITGEGNLIGLAEIGNEGDFGIPIEDDKGGYTERIDRVNSGALQVEGEGW